MMDYKKEYLNLIKKYEKLHDKLNSYVEYKDLIIEVFDEKIKVLEDDLERAVKAGMPTSILYDEIDELETLKEEVLQLWYKID